MEIGPDELNDPQFRKQLGAQSILEERFARGVATPRERLAVVALHELPDESDEAAVQTWVPSAAFRTGVRTVALSTVEFYIGLVDVLLDQADGDVETTHWTHQVEDREARTRPRRRPAPGTATPASPSEHDKSHRSPPTPAGQPWSPPPVTTRPR